MLGASSVSNTLSAPSSGWAGWGSNGTGTETGTFNVDKGDTADVFWEVTLSIKVDGEGTVGTAAGARTVKPFVGTMELGVKRSSTGRKAGRTSIPPLSLGESISMDSILPPLLILVLLLRKGKGALPVPDAD